MAFSWPLKVFKAATAATIFFVIAASDEAAVFNAFMARTASAREEGPSIVEWRIATDIMPDRKIQKDRTRQTTFFTAATIFHKNRRLFTTATEDPVFSRHFSKRPDFKGVEKTENRKSAT